MSFQQYRFEPLQNNQSTILRNKNNNESLHNISQYIWAMEFWFDHAR